jgi:hypothetical protein
MIKFQFFIFIILFLFQIELQESDHCEDIVAYTKNTRSFHTEEIGNSVQVDTSSGPEFANVSIWSKVDQDTDLSHTKQFRRYTEENETSKIVTEARKHEVEEIPLVDDSVIFQVNRKIIMYVLLLPVS